MHTDYYKVLEVDKSTSAEGIKQAFRRLAKKYHPDVNKGDDSRFKEIAAANEVLSDPEARAKYDRGGLAKPFVIKTKKGSYSIEFLHKSGDLADIYTGTNLDNYNDVAFKVSKEPSNNDLLEAEARNLKEMFPPDQAEEKRYRYLPRFIESLKIVDGGKHKQANILGWLSNFHTLVEVRKAFEDTLPMEHGVWMFNRVLEGLDFVHTKKNMVHGALTPDHVMVYSAGREKDPYNHGAKMIDWSYSVKIGEKIKALSPKWESFYPPEVLQGKPATPATDLYMAAKSILYVLGADANDVMPKDIPLYLRGFLRGCLLKSQSARPQDAWKLYKEFTEHMNQNYGPKKYVRFDMPQ